MSRAEKDLREAILEQTAGVIKLKVKPEIEEARRKLVSLKEEYRTVTGSEWSDLREECPLRLSQSLFVVHHNAAKTSTKLLLPGCDQ